MIYLKVFGRFYAWSERFKIINVGDYVTWSWNSPIGIENVKFRIEQVGSRVSTNPIGFSSGESTKSG